jgi:hypothetical protein
MPNFLTPLHEFNPCHNPAGSPAGGEFCATGTGGEEPQFVVRQYRRHQARHVSQFFKIIDRHAKTTVRTGIGSEQDAQAEAARLNTGASSPPVVSSGGGQTVKSYGKFADALLARIDDRGHHIIMFGTTGKRSRNRSKNHFGMRDRAAAEKLRKAGVIKIESGGVSSYKPRTGSWRTAWATEWVLSRA